jgi:hypothetical protein
MSSIDSRSVTAKGDRILDIANMKDGKTVGTGKTEVAKDGKSRTLQTDGTLPDGTNTTPSTSSTSHRRVSYPFGASVSQVHLARLFLCNS